VTAERVDIIFDKDVRLNAKPLVSNKVCPTRGMNTKEEDNRGWTPRPELNVVTDLDQHQSISSAIVEMVLLSRQIERRYVKAGFSQDTDWTAGTDNPSSVCGKSDTGSNAKGAKIIV
jgi:hypothetical protein